jgi:hypothetical protein
MFHQGAWRRFNVISEPASMDKSIYQDTETEVFAARIKHNRGRTIHAGHGSGVRRGEVCNPLVQSRLPILTPFLISAIRQRRRIAARNSGRPGKWLTLKQEAFLAMKSRGGLIVSQSQSDHIIREITPAAFGPRVASRGVVRVTCEVKGFCF